MVSRMLMTCGCARSAVVVLARDVSSLLPSPLTIERLGRPLTSGDAVDFDLPPDLVDYLAELDDFIEREIRPLQAQDDNERFFDHRREDAARTGIAAACRTKTGRPCSPRCVAGQTPPAITGTRSRRSTAARTAPTSAWP